MSTTSRSSAVITIVLFGWMLSSLTLFMDPLFNINVNPALYRSTDLVISVIGGTISFGSALVLVSKSSRIKQATTVWQLEMLGLPTLISGWGLYTVTIFLSDGFVLYPIIIGLFYTIACGYRLVNLLFYVKRVRNSEIEKLIKPLQER